MICSSCNAALGPDVRFCPRCGTPAAPQQASLSQPASTFYPPSTSHRFRVTRNLQALGILWCLFGAYRIVGGLIGMLFLHAIANHAFGGWPFPEQMTSHLPQTWMAILVPLLAAATAVSSVLAFLTGYALLTRRTWGRTLAIVAAVLALFKFPLGSALGIYTLWVLAPGDSGVEYDALSSATGPAQNGVAVS